MLEIACAVGRGVIGSRFSGCSAKRLSATQGVRRSVLLSRGSRRGYAWKPLTFLFMVASSGGWFWRVKGKRRRPVMDTAPNATHGCHKTLNRDIYKH